MPIWDSVVLWFSDNIANIALITIIILATFIVAKLVDRLLARQFELISKKMEVDETAYRLLRRISIAVIYLIGIIVIITSIPFLANLSIALFAGAGFAGIIVGMAAQSTLSNIISGISLVIFRPFRVGDLVNIREEYGKISDITLRHTVVTTWDNRRLIIPNHIISDEAVINWSIEDPTAYWPVDVGIGYDCDIDLARSIMIEEARNHKNVMSYTGVKIYHPDVKDGEEVRVILTELGDFSVNMRLTFWVHDRSVAYTTGCDLIESIKKRFDAEGIEIPYPYRTIVYKKDLAEN